jgi:hypothetical protein
MRNETREELQRFVIAIAPDHIAREDAPENLQELIEWKMYEGGPIPVSSLYCDRTLFTSPEGNHAMRAWHDWLHILTGLETEFADEMELGLVHAETAERYGCTSEAVKALLWDMCGQSLFYEATGNFPVNQLAFVDWCLAKWPECTPAGLRVTHWPDLIATIKSEHEQGDPALEACS